MAIVRGQLVSDLICSRAVSTMFWVEKHHSPHAPGRVRVRVRARVRVRVLGVP